MKRGFYFRLALDGMRKNRRLYVPYLLTCAGMVMMFYILSSLAYSPLMETMRGGDTMAIVLKLGTVVIALFSLLFLFYTNAFLVRRRNKEFGLYNILGMNKRNLSRILLWETLLTALFALIVGLACGLLFAKLAELFLLHMAGAAVGYALRIEPKSIAAALAFFGAIFLLLLLASLARVHLAKPLDLLKSEAAGEKPPKANWIFAVLGVALLGVAYYLAITIESPLSAVLLFFGAVLIVIVGTYLLFIAGSVAMCRLLQKNKAYYYKSSHFVSVSSMAFRMKRNGAGLASICILATMVLVMLSSTSCLYFGGDDALRGRYPYDMTYEITCDSPADCMDDEPLVTLARDSAQGHADGLLTYRALETSGSFANGVLDINGYNRRTELDSKSMMQELARVRGVVLVPLSDYSRLAGVEPELAPGEALLWSSDGTYEYDAFTVLGCRTLHIRETLDRLPFRVSTYDSFTTLYYLFVPDWEAYAGEVKQCVAGFGDELITASVAQYCCFDLPDLSEPEQIETAQRFRNAAAEESQVRPDWLDFTVGSRAENRSDFFGTFGSLFFLGIILSIVFIAAAALIIYYKQLSEGYEDQSRFDIMQKVGMTRREIKSAINSQVLTVFFAPLLLAGVHLAFAFPFVQKIIRVFGVFNIPLLIVTNIICFFAFALFYVFVYRATARAYYNIVSDAQIRR